MHNRHFVKEPWGWKIRRFFKAISKKLNLEITHNKKLEILKKKGLKIGKNVIIDKDAIIDSNYCHLISIGDNSIICADAKVIAHDSTIHLSTNHHGRAAKVEIKENCIISVNAIILPGVTIGPNVLVTAGAVVNKDIPPDSCVAGVPARYYGKFSDYIAYHNKKIAQDYVFERIEMIKDKETFKKEKNKMIAEAKKREIYYKTRTEK